MELNELIHKIDKARTKDDLEALGIEHLGVDVDKRKAKEVLRAELLTEAESRLPEDAEKVSEPGMANPYAAPEPESQPEAAAVTEAAPEPVKPASNFKGKMARNKKTGRIMAWTAAMGKMSHMEEI